MSVPILRIDYFFDFPERKCIWRTPFRQAFDWIMSLSIQYLGGAYSGLCKNMSKHDEQFRELVLLLDHGSAIIFEALRQEIQSFRAIPDEYARGVVLRVLIDKAFSEEVEASEVTTWTCSNTGNSQETIQNERNR